MLKFKDKIKYLIVLSGALIIYGCSSSTKLESIQSNNEIKIDGVQTDWANKLKPVKDENVMVGFQNDNDNLYVCLVTASRPEMMKILSMGLTVWLEPSKSKDMIGIRYPLKLDPAEMRQYRSENDEEGQPANPQERINRMLSEQNELQVVDKDENVLTTIPLNEHLGFDAKVGYSMDQFVYELKVPLGNDKNKLALNTDNKDEIKVKFETGKFDLNQFRNNVGMRRGPEGGEGGEGGGMGGRGRMGGFGGRRGGGAGQGRGGDSGASRANFMQPIKFEVDLKLAGR